MKFGEMARQDLPIMGSLYVLCANNM